MDVGSSLCFYITLDKLNLFLGQRNSQEIKNVLYIALFVDGERSVREFTKLAGSH